MVTKTTDRDYFNPTEIVVTAIIGRVQIGHGSESALSVAFGIVGNYLGEMLNTDGTVAEASFTAFGHVFTGSVHPDSLEK